MRLLIATCSRLPEGDEDAAALTAALAGLGVQARWVSWDDPGVDWAAAPVLIRSTWDYPERPAEFLAWAAAVPRLVNPSPVVAWNSDKTYLLDLAAAGVPVTPTAVVPPGGRFTPPEAAEFVVKPSVGSGSRGAGRFGAADPAAALEHLRLLHAEGYTALVQPYLSGVDEVGETALLFFGGRFSHAIGKGAMLPSGVRHPLGAGAYVPSVISARTPSAAEVATGQAALGLVSRRFADVLRGRPLPYARVDLLPGVAGPVVVELELVEPFWFLGYGDGAAGRAAAAVAQFVGLAA